MTAFASRTGTHGERSWTLDLKSVNGRGLDVKLRLPSLLDAEEPAIRKMAGTRLTRGTVSITLRLESEATGAGYRINEELLENLTKTLLDASRRTGLPAPSLDALVRIPGVLEQAEREEPDEGLASALVASLRDGLDALAAARAEEGAQLKAILSDQLDRLARLTEAAQAAGAARPEARQAKLHALVTDLDVALDADRLAQEIALLAVRIDIREEIDRLHAHVAAVRDLIAGGGPVGRRLDFFAQELNREANTLCSKAQDPELTGIGVEMKVIIDQFREQVMNVE
ncbi:MAG: YicC/YloC family endoribonuclease [Pseudomonadota bacterium]